MAKPKTPLLAKVSWGVGATILAGLFFPPAIPFVAGAAIAGIAGSEMYNASKEDESTLNSGKKVGATAAISFGAAMIAGALFPPLGLAGLVVGAIATAGVAVKEAGGPKQAWNKVRNFFKPSKTEPKDIPLTDVNTHKKKQQQEPKQKQEPTAEQRRQAEAMRKKLEDQRNLESDTPLSTSITEAFDKFKREHHNENRAVKRTDNSMTFPDQTSAIELMKQQAEKNQAFELGDVAKDFYVFSDGRGNFYEGNKEGLDAFKQELQEQHQQRKVNFNPVLTELNTTGLSALPEHRNEVEVEPLAGIKINHD